MTQAEDVFDVIKFYADRFDFNNCSEFNHFQYQMLKADLERLNVNVVDRSANNLNSSLHSARTEITKMLYLIYNIQDNKDLQKELRDLVDKEKEGRERKLVKLGVSIYNYVY